MIAIRRRCLLAGTVVVLLWAIAGCATLPLPDGPDQSLAVVLYDFREIRYDTSWGVIGATATIVHPQTGRRTRLILPVHRTWTSVALDPGLYRLQELTFQFREHRMDGDDRYWSEFHGLSSPIYVEPLTVLVARNMIRVNRRGSHRHYDVRLTLVTDRSEYLRTATDTVRRNRMWSAWDGYTELGLYRSTDS